MGDDGYLEISTKKNNRRNVGSKLIWSSVTKEE